MLSVPTFKLPRKVVIKVAKAEKLVPSQKDNKKKLNNKYRVTIVGGKKKEASALIEAIDGNPEWSFSITIKLPRGKTDPVCLLIEDSEGHHKGQVIIPLVKIGPKPYTHTPDQTPATSTNLICAELEPTNKCSTAHGLLYYWIWVDEYCADGDSDSRKSFTKSVSSIFGSRNTLSKPSGSIGNMSSNSSLNKPETHKSALDFLHIKSKKDKSKKSSSNLRKGTNSSDADSYMGSGIIFDANKVGQHNKNISYGSNDLQLGSNGNPFIGGDERTASNKSFNALPDRLDMLSHGSHGSISESGSSSRYGDAQEYYNGIAPMASESSKQGKYDHQRFESGSSHRDFDQRYQPGHMSISSSEFSGFSDRGIHQPVSMTVKMMNDDAEMIRKENSDLRAQNITMSQKVSQLQTELDSVKDSLFKLRMRLLEEGATKYLEKA